MPMHQLFHQIADPASAVLRKVISEKGLENIQFRNTLASEQARTDLREGTGSDRVPALLTADGRWLRETAEIEAFLRSL